MLYAENNALEAPDNALEPATVSTLATQRHETPQIRPAKK